MFCTIYRRQGESRRNVSPFSYFTFNRK